MTLIQHDKAFTVTFKINKIFWHGRDGFTTFSAKTSSYEGSPSITPAHIVGKGYFLDVNEEDTYRCEGVFTADRANGFIFEMKGIPLAVIPTSTDKLAKYIAKRIPGISLKKMKEVVRIFGADLISIINKEPGLLKEKTNLKSKQRELLINFCHENDALDDLLAQFLSLGLGIKHAIKLYSAYGINSLYAIERDAYALYQFKVMSFADVDTLVAGKELFEINSPERIETAMLALFDRKAKEEGHVCMSISLIKRYFQRFVDDNNGFGTRYVFSESEIEAALTHLITKGLVKKVAIQDGTDVYYRTERYENERVAAEYIAKNWAASTYLCEHIDEITETVKKNTWLGLKQKEAVLTSLTHKISVLTGGPGTGKTYSINAMIKLIESYPGPNGLLPTIKLCAPTGKAAQRMTELTKRPAQTLHTALKLIPDEDENGIPTFDPNDGFKLETDWLIVDELSMVDAELFANIIRRTSETANIILCGDKDQLPSVGEGAVIEQLLGSEIVASTTLDRIYRQNTEDTSIVDMSYLIKDKKYDEIWNFDHSDKKGFSFMIEEGDDVISEHVCDLYYKYVEEYGRENVLILTPIRKKGLCCTNFLNEQIQSHIFGNSGQKPKYGLYVGDRVIQIVNNKVQGVFNGELGYVREVLSAKEYRKRFQGKLKKNVHGVDIDPSSPAVCVNFDGKGEKWVWKEEIELAYALTVHKAQGSETDIVIMPFSETRSHRYMQRSKLIYTALTRAKKKFIGLGSWECFCEGSCKDEPFRRQSLLSYMSRQMIKNKNKRDGASVSSSE